MKKYVIVVRSKISTSRSKTKETYKRLDCYYESPAFVCDGTWQSLDKALDCFYDQFKHFIGWSVEMIEVA